MLRNADVCTSLKMAQNVPGQQALGKPSQSQKLCKTLCSLKCHPVAGQKDPTKFAMVSNKISNLFSSNWL